MTEQETCKHRWSFYSHFPAAYFCHKCGTEKPVWLMGFYAEEVQARAEKAEAMVERMVEAGNRLCELAEELDDLVDEFRAYPDLVSWRAIVAEWKERE